MKIGKLDPKNMFDKSQERETCITKEKDMFNNVVIGKLNTKNIFESEDIVEIGKQTLQVGKINARVSRTNQLTSKTLNIRFINRKYLLKMTPTWLNHAL